MPFFTAGVIFVQRVERRPRQRGTLAQQREQQLRFLALMALLRKFIDIEKHRAHGRKVGQRGMALMLCKQQRNRPQHGRQRGVLFANDAGGDVGHGSLQAGS